jgi:hypothetical protein
VGWFGLPYTWLGLGGTPKGMRVCLHLLESVYDRRVELMFVSEMSFEVATSRECLWAERAAMPSEESTEDPVEVKVTNWQSLQWRRGKLLWYIQLLQEERPRLNTNDNRIYSIRWPVVGSAVCLLMRCVLRWSLVLNDFGQRKQY